MRCDGETAGARMVNDGDGDGLLRSVIPDAGGAGYYVVSFEGEKLSGSAGVLYVVDEYNHVLGEATLGSKTLLKLPAAQEHALLVKVFPHSGVLVTRAAVASAAGDDPVHDFCDSVLKGNVAVVVPTYPAQENTYPCAFVHARVRAYREAHVACDVLCAFDYEGYCAYEFEGVRVLRMPMDELARLLCWRSYRAVLLHFFDLRYARELDRAGLDDTPIFLWSHNPETRYWDWTLFTAPYFGDPPKLSPEQEAEFRERDAVIARYNDKPNVSWVFVSEALKWRSEELLGLEFKRAHVIPNLVDDKVFRFQAKDPDLRKKVFLTRKFDNVSTYALDVVANVIVELSRRPFFSDMEFDLYGAGDLYDKLVEPLRGFENVRLHRRFLSRSEIASEHRSHGIALYPTRFDSQGVSMGEAAMSGLAVVSSDIDAARCFLPDDQGLLCEVEDAAAYADVIERLYRDPQAFAAASEACHDKVLRLCSRKQTVNREISLIKRCVGRSVARVLGNMVADRRYRSGLSER